MKYSFDGFELDETRFRLYREGRSVTIQPRPLQLLLHLVRHRDRLVHREEVLETLWPGLRPSQASLDRAVRAARRALGDRGHEPRYIATVRNVGFRFLPDVECDGAPRASTPTSESEARILELLLEVTELALQAGRTDQARRRGLEAATVARTHQDGEALVRAAVLLGQSVNGNVRNDPEVVDVARAALSQLGGASADPRADQLNALVAG
ncbi:MAG: winged helix-turn-helix domain-containing protein [Myxococcota bacterium]